MSSSIHHSNSTGHSNYDAKKANVVKVSVGCFGMSLSSQSLGCGTDNANLQQLR